MSLPTSTMHKPLHPGAIVKDALFTDTDLTISEAASRLKVDRTTLSRLLNEHSGISPDMAYRLSLLLNTSAEMWINVQKDYDLWAAKRRNRGIKIKALFTAGHFDDNGKAHVGA